MWVTGGTLVSIGTKAVKRSVGVDALVTAGKVLRTFVHVDASPAVVFQTKPPPARTLQKKINEKIVHESYKNLSITYLGYF